MITQKTFASNWLYEIQNKILGFVKDIPPQEFIKLEISAVKDPDTQKVLGYSGSVDYLTSDVVTRKSAPIEVNDKSSEKVLEKETVSGQADLTSLELEDEEVEEVKEDALEWSPENDKPKKTAKQSKEEKKQAAKNKAS